MYGNFSATAVQPAMPSTDATRTTSPFDGGYEMPSGFGMYTMADDADDTNVTTGGLGGAALGSMSSASLYNAPSYYQAGSYGGFPNGGTYRVQSSRRVTGAAAMQASPSTTHTHAAGGSGAGMYGGTTGGQAMAKAIGGGASMRRSDYGGLGGSAFDDDDTSDFYGGGGVGGEGAAVNPHLLPNSGGVRSGATTATSLGDCHLSRKDDGGFTPQTDNTFLRSHGSLGGGSVDSRGGDRSALSDGGLNSNGVNGSSAYGAGFFSANVSRHGSDFTASQPLQQRRLSDPPLCATQGSSSSTISTVSAGPQQQQAQQERGPTTSAPLSKSGDHVAPVLAASPTPRVVSRQISPQRSATGPKSAVSMPRRSGSFHRLSGTAEDSIFAPFYETERNKSPVSTPPAPTAGATTAAAAASTIPAPPPTGTTSASNSPRKAPIASTAAPAIKPMTAAATAAEGTTTAKAPSQPSTAIPVLPSVSDKPSARGRSVSLPSRATAESANTAAAPPTPVLTSTSEVSPMSKKERAMRTHIEGVEEVASSHSGDSATRKPRTPPSRKPAKDKTTPPSKHTGTVLPPAFSAATTTATHPAISTVIETHQGIANISPNNAQRRISTHTVVSSASTSAVTGTADSKDTTLSSLSPIQLSQTMQAAASQQQQQQQQPLPQPPQAQMAFTVAPPPSETRDPKRYYRRHHLQPSVAPLSATEVSKPVGAPTATAAAAATSRNADASLKSSSVSSAAAPLTASKRAPSARDTRLGASLLSNRSPMAVNNLVGNGISSGAVTANNNSPHVNNGGTSTIGGIAGGVGKTQRLPATSERRRMPSATGSIVPQTNGTDVQTNSAPQRKRSGSETHSLNDIAGTAQTRSCPSMELSTDEGTNPYLQRRSSSWSAHSTVCSSDSGEGSHTSSVRRKRQQDRMLPSVEEEMERYSMARFGVRF